MLQDSPFSFLPDSPLLGLKVTFLAVRLISDYS